MIEIIQEYGLSVDDFNNPKVYKGIEGIGALLVHLLLLEPGTIQSHPELGIGVVSRYRYSFEGRADELEAEFRSQIQKFLPNLQGVIISVKEGNKMYYITAQVDSDVYGITLDKDMNINTTYKSLNDLKNY